MKKIITATVIISFCSAMVLLYARINNSGDDRFVSYSADSHSQDIELYWKDSSGNNFKNISNLQSWLALHHKELLFAMNGGMYKRDHSPQGLYIENGKELSPVDSSSGGGNFYMKPNGVFYITRSNDAGICLTENIYKQKEIKYATQSGPMLVIDGEIHPAFKPGSQNINIRNGVGILQGNKILFAMSKKEINFYDFAAYFKSMGCRQALYLDGFVSRTYLPEKNWVQTDGDFGVIIAVSKQVNK